MDLDTIKRQIDELDERFALWVEPIDRVHLRGLSKVNRDRYTLQDHEREVEDMRRLKYLEKSGEEARNERSPRWKRVLGV